MKCWIITRGKDGGDVIQYIYTNKFIAEQNYQKAKALFDDCNDLKQFDVNVDFSYITIYRCSIDIDSGEKTELPQIVAWKEDAFIYSDDDIKPLSSLGYKGQSQTLYSLESQARANELATKFREDVLEIEKNRIDEDGETS